MKIMAITGGYRRGRTIDALVAAALRGVLDVEPAAEIESIRLIDRRIEYCRGCLVCHNDDPAKPLANCAIRDDMAEICRKLYDADGYIFASPMYEGTITAVMKCFLERLCWVMARPGHRPLEGCPEPRNPRPKAAICITSTGQIGHLLSRWFCQVGRTFKNCIPCTLNAPILGLLYACRVGMNRPRQPDRYLPRAFELGRKLARRVRKL